MIITIKRKQNEKQLEKLKYTLILKNKAIVKIVYDWKIKGENSDESLEDFHIFCLSVVKDILEKKIDGDYINYEIDEDCIDTEATLEDLEYLYNIIAHKKLKRV